MSTDIDRLHRVVSGDISGRRAGHTFAYCHEVASLIELGEREIIVLLPSLKWASHVLPMLDRVLASRGVGYLASRPIGRFSFCVAGSIVSIASSQDPRALLGKSCAVVEVLA